MDEKIASSLEELEVLIDKCDTDFVKIDGAIKLKRKLEAERKFLNSLKACDAKVKEASLGCLNLISLKALVKQIENLENITSIYKTFKDSQNNILNIDIVYDFGYKWAKIIARNPQALHLKYFCEYDTELIRQAEQYLNTAESNTCNYTVPKILFHFSNGITQALCNKVEKYVFVSGPIAEVDKDLEEKLRIQAEEELSSDEEIISETITRAKSEESCSEFKDLILENKQFGSLTKINFDVTTLLALISDLSNGNYNYQFDKDYLNQQAASEKKCSLVPIIEEFIKDKELFICQSAYDSLVDIVSTVGGKQERIRWEYLKQRIKLVPDNPDKKVMQLKENKRIKHRTKVIFGTGEYLQAITTTSNLHFVRAANSQGCNFTVYLHQPRALTEQKAERDRLQRI